MEFQKKLFRMETSMARADAMRDWIEKIFFKIYAIPIFTSRPEKPTPQI